MSQALVKAIDDLLALFHKGPVLLVLCKGTQLTCFAPWGKAHPEDDELKDHVLRRNDALAEQILEADRHVWVEACKLTLEDRLPQGDGAECFGKTNIPVWLEAHDSVWERGAPSWHHDQLAMQRWRQDLLALREFVIPRTGMTDFAGANRWEILLTALGDDSSLRILNVAEDRNKSADEKMNDIYHIDHRVLSWDSGAWSRVLGVQSSAIRQTGWWNGERKNLLAKEQDD